MRPITWPCDVHGNTLLRCPTGQDRRALVRPTVLLWVPPFDPASEGFPSAAPQAVRASSPRVRMQ